MLRLSSNVGRDTGGPTDINSGGARGCRVDGYIVTTRSDVDISGRTGLSSDVGCCGTAGRRTHDTKVQSFTIASLRRWRVVNISIY